MIGQLTRTSIALCLLNSLALAASPPATQPDRAAQGPAVVADVHPGLSPGCLNFARLDKLPEGVLLKAGELLVEGKELDEAIEKMSEPFRPLARANAVFLLEQIVHDRLLVLAARRDLTAAGQDLEGKSDDELIDAWLKPVAEKSAVAPKEIEEFCEANEPLFGGTPLKDIEKEIAAYLLGRKRAQAAREHVRTLGRRMEISISADWVNAQARLASDNPIDKARANGKATLAAFGSAGCCGPDASGPIMEELIERLGERANVLHLDIHEHELLAARLGVYDAPAQIFYDARGKEAHRHEGMMSPEQMEKKLAELGVGRAKP